MNKGIWLLSLLVVALLSSCQWHEADAVVAMADSID